LKKKIIYAVAIMSLILFLPAFNGEAQLSPELASGNNVTANASYDYDGNTIEIIEQTSEKTTILLNDTYQLELEHNDTNVGVLATKLDTGLSIEADEMLFDVDFETNVDGQHVSVDLPDISFDLDMGGPNNDVASIGIIGEDSMDMSYNTTSGDFAWTDGVHAIDLVKGVLSIDGGQYVVSRINDTAWDINTPSGIVVLNYNPGAGVMGIEYFVLYYFGSIPPVPNTVPFYVDSVISLSWDGFSLTIGGPGYSIMLSAWTLVFVFDYIVFTWYFGIYIERIVIIYWDVTIIIYLTIVELLIVIIYYTFEIKIYETTIVIIYELITIIFVFISIFIWELTFIFYFEFWYIEIIFIIDIIINIIIQPVRFIFIPIIVPVFIPVIFFVPVLIIQYIHIYVPYASPALHIDVYDEDLAMPTHTIQYLVYDEAETPIVDATVTVDYNGSVYPASHIGSGVYEVDLPASNITKAIIVTATKTWYPDAVLSYDLGIDWLIGITTVTETGTPTAPLPIVAVVASLLCMAIGTTIITKKKK